MAAFSVGKGLVDSANAKQQQRRADSLHAQIPEADPGVLSALNNIRQMRKYAESGMTRMNAYKTQQIQNAGLQGMANQRRLAGGSPGAAQQGLARSQAATQNALMGQAAQTEAMVPQLLGMETPLVSDMADRSLSLKTYMRDAAQFRGAVQQQSANNMITGGLGILSAVEPSVWAQGRAPQTIAQPPRYGAPGAPVLGNPFEVADPFAPQYA